ncbi:MAG: 50S ribosomal protein L22 [Bacteroidota bacterium]
MEANAILKKLHVSPRKVGLIATLIRGMNAEKALQTLQVTQKGAAPNISKLLKCAIANYQSREGQGETQPEELYIKEIYVGSAGMLKRIQPAPRGVAHRIRKRMSHVTLVVDKQSPKKEKARKKAPAKKQSSTTTQQPQTNTQT